VGLTGGGAGKLERQLDGQTLRVNEFAAWGDGAAELLRRLELGSARRYLLVSLGTGTSVMLVDGMAVNRIGGTALGGGTVVGLGAIALISPRSLGWPSAETDGAWICWSRTSTGPGRSPCSAT
jgi:pantothenate kinase